MEGKTVILSVFIMSLVMAQIQVEAATICCPSAQARSRFYACLAVLFTPRSCAKSSGCIAITGKCTPPYNDEILENSGDNVNDYCKLGCVSSVCSALTTLENSDASEIVNGAVDQCVKACSTFCIKGSKNEVEAA